MTVRADVSQAVQHTSCGESLSLAVESPASAGVPGTQSVLKFP